MRAVAHSAQPKKRLTALPKSMKMNPNIQIYTK